MSIRQYKPVLIIGGSGFVGAETVRTLRRLHPDLPIVVGGRNLARAEAVAAEVGNASAAAVDLSRRDLGLPDTAAFSAVAIFVKDDRFNALHYAQDHGLPFVSISSGTFEIGPDVALAVHRPQSSAIVLASHWLAGAAVFPALHAAAGFQRIDSIKIGVVLDEQDMGGPAASADFDRLTTVAPAALTVQNGRFVWVTGDDAKGQLRSVDGVLLDTFAYSPLDVIGLAAATDARNISFDLAYGESASRRRGEPFSTEIIIELEGIGRNGRPAAARHEIVHPSGQAPLTALGVSLAVERLLGISGGVPVAPGLYLPEVLIEPAAFVQRMKEFGSQFQVHEVEPA